MDTKRIMNSEAEKIVLSAILEKNDLILNVVDRLEINDFYDSKHQIIYSIMKILYSKGSLIDVTTIVELLGNDLLEVGGVSYLASLHTPTLQIKDHVNIIIEKSKMRKLNLILQRSLKEVEDGSKNAEDIVNELEKKNLEITDRKVNELVNDSKLMELTLKIVEDNFKSNGKILGIESGISILDRAINGFQKSKLYIMAGRPGMCKSAFALNVVQNASIKNNILYYNLEMPEEELGFRRIAMTSFINGIKIERGNLSDEEWTSIGQASNLIATGKVNTNCKANIHLNTIRAQAKKMKLQNGLDMIVIDYIGLISKKDMGNTAAEQISNMASGLKILAKELQLPIIALSQLNRGCEQRVDGKGGHRPMLSDLKESGGIEENADCVMLLYRDEYYNKDTEDKNCLEVDIAKQRSGRTGVIKLGWKAEYQKVLDIF